MYLKHVPQNTYPKTRSGTTPPHPCISHAFKRDAAFTPLHPRLMLTGLATHGL